MRRRLGGLFERYGQWVQRQSDGTQWRAFVQPVRDKNKESDREMTALGEVDLRRWLYIGPAEMPLEEGEILTCGGERFAVRERVKTWVGETPVYERAILVKAKEEAA